MTSDPNSTAPPAAGAPGGPPKRLDEPTGGKGTEYMVLFQHVGVSDVREWHELGKAQATSQAQAKRMALACARGQTLVEGVLAGTHQVDLVAIPNFAPTQLDVDPPKPPRIRV